MSQTTPENKAVVFDELLLLLINPGRAAALGELIEAAEEIELALERRNIPFSARTALRAALAKIKTT